MSGHECDESWCPTIESEPEHYGVGMVGVLDVDLEFGFDSFLIVRDPATGDLLWAHDQGCSCPVPFDGVTPDDGMCRGTARDCLTDLQAWASAGDWGRLPMIRAAADTAWFQGLLAEAGYDKAVIFA